MQLAAHARGEEMARRSRSLSGERCEERCCLSAVAFEVHTIRDGGSTGDVLSIEAADLDDDGDLDLVATGLGANPTVGWYENIDGKGTFGNRQLIADGGLGGTSVYPADLNQDGRMDIVSGLHPPSVVWNDNSTARERTVRSNRSTR